jgi:hypothetical protein
LAWLGRDQGDLSRKVALGWRLDAWFDGVLDASNLVDSCRLVGFGWHGVKSMHLWRQDGGQCACAAAFVEALRKGRRRFRWKRSGRSVG